MKTLANVGEFGLIERLRKKIKKGSGVRLGIGDDAAVVRANRGKELLFTTDMLIEDRHFRRREATAFEIGWKALAVNVSDIAAMGGRPTYAVAAVGLPKNLGIGFADGIYKGLCALAKRFGISLVGGDANQSDKVVIAVSLLGEIKPGAFVGRGGARPGDVIFVTGSLGGSYKSRKHLRFTPRIAESQFLLKRFKIHSMIDVSDGLASDIRRIAEESGVGAVLSKEAIPVSRFAKNFEAAVTEGEDFELLFALSSKEAARLSSYPLKKGLAPFHPIGRIVEKQRGIKLTRDDRKIEAFPQKGFDHFA
jgi:thiamine-monophosphate kinase